MRFLARSHRTTTLCIVAALALAAPLPAAAPRDELLRFVPDDVGFCVVLQDLRVHAADLVASPFVEQLRRSPLGAALQASNELKQLDKVDKDLRQTLGVGFDELRDDLLGDAVVIAYQPGPPGKADKEQGLVLVRARTAEVLAGLVEKINAAQRKDGTLTDLQPCEYHDATYFRRVEAKQTNYYYLRGPVFLFTGQEEVLRRAIDVDQKAAADAEPALTRRLRQIGADRAALALWLNPRAFDAILEDKTAKTEGAGVALQKKVMTYWKALDGVAAWVTLDTELHFSLAEQVRTADLPPAARKVLAGEAGPGELWRYMPDDALLACGGRFDAAALMELLQDFQPAEEGGAAAANAVFGKDFLQDVLSHLGPDWGFCLTAPPAGAKEWLPQALLAVRAAPGDETAPADQALLSAVHAAAALTVLGHNHQAPKEPLRLKSATFHQQEIHYLSGDGVFPPGVQPAYALTNGWMTFASSPEVIRRFAEASPKAAVADGVSFPLLRASLKAWRVYLKERRDPLAAALAEKNQMTVEETRRRLDDLAGVLQFVDRLEIDCRTGPGLAVVTLTVRTAQPLKKTGG